MRDKIILLVDDDESFCKVLEYNLREIGYQVIPSHSGEEAIEVFREKEVDLVLTDIQMPGMSGLELLYEVKRLNPEMLVIIITAFGSVDTAVDAMKNGAFDYITKPFNRDELHLTIEKAFQMMRLSNENLRLHQQLVERFSFSNIIGGSKKMQELFEMAGRVAHTDSTVLISGESGTGKELIARAIHFNSNRRDKNFVAVNCSSIPETLLESELFGYIKGAFTGAVKDKEGRFELADGGTLFLDEVRDLPIELQPKLLRVLQEKEIDKIGGSRPVKIDVRIIAATNRSLEDAVKSGEFREDLYYRLSVVPLTVPPLRERKDDIPLLIQHFLHKFNAGPCKIDAEVMAAFKMFHWPGNIRELENVIERALVLGQDKGRITLQDIPENIGRKDISQVERLLIDIPDEGIQLEEVEKGLILYALKIKNHNQTQAANFLGITRQTLIYRMEKYGIKT